MTKEAINELKKYTSGKKNTEKVEISVLQLNRVIKALEEQEPCEDAISREDALMCLTGEIKETDTIETIIARSRRRIRKLSSVNPQESEE